MEKIRIRGLIYDNADCIYCNIRDCPYYVVYMYTCVLLLLWRTFKGLVYCLNHHPAPCLPPLPHLHTTTRRHKGLVSHSISSHIDFFLYALSNLL